MCGIGGVFFCERNHQPDVSKISAALSTLASRGPDGKGHMVLPGILLLHTRLSIIDVSEKSAQPMSHQNGRYTLVYNGELFNYKELRDELKQQGVSFSSDGDAEVVLQAWITYGKKALHKLNGFFAFALYDKQEHTLLVVRDAMGEKPLYVGTNTADNSLYFGSHLHTLHTLGMPWKLDTDATRVFFHLNYFPAPYTPVLNVEKIVPGHARLYSPGGMQEWNFAQHAFETNAGNSQNESLYKVLEAAVQRRMVSDVPVAAFLSGGIDSGIVCALAQKINPSIQTFSAGFSGNKMFDESGFASETAKKLGLSHTVVHLDEETMLQSVCAMLQQVDEPFADSSAIALNALCQKIKGQYKVVLSGDGADELFAGYNKHRAEWRLRTRGFSSTHKLAAVMLSVFGKNRHSKLGNLNRKIDKLKKGAALSPAERYWLWAGYSDTGMGDVFLSSPSEKSLAIKKYCTRFIEKDNDMEHVLVNDIHLVLTNDMLYKTDFFGMSNAVEIRSPFLDKQVVAAALRIPAASKVDVDTGKKILRETFKNDLPADVFTRPKHGFEVPLHQWLTGPLRETMHNLLQDETLYSLGLFDKEKINSVMQKLHSSNPGDAHATCWALMQFSAFYKRYNWTVA